MENQATGSNKLTTYPYSFYSIAKRFTDIAISLIILVIFSPIFLIISLLIKLDSPGPVIYSQERVGKHGKIFKIIKFRSMVVNADNLLWESNPQLLEEYKRNSYKLTNDPRITGIGEIIRRLSLDELPQFWNVLTGDMSIVGPRACKPNELRDQQEVFPESKKYVANLLSVRPGITGPWQVGGRNDINFDERTRLGAEYASKKSLIYDFIIMLKTPWAAIAGTGIVTKG